MSSSSLSFTLFSPSPSQSTEEGGNDGNGGTGKERRGKFGPRLGRVVVERSTPSFHPPPASSHGASLESRTTPEDATATTTIGGEGTTTTKTAKTETTRTQTKKTTVITLDTPALFTTTSRGVVSHISRDNYARLGGAMRWTSVPFETFLEHNPPVPVLYASTLSSPPPVPPSPSPPAPISSSTQDSPPPSITLEASAGPLHNFLTIPPSSILALTARDPADVRAMPANANDALCVGTLRGVRRISPTTYTSHAHALRPDVVVALSDTPFSAPSPSSSSSSVNLLSPSSTTLSSANSPFSGSASPLSFGNTPSSSGTPTGTSTGGDATGNGGNGGGGSNGTGTPYSQKRLTKSVERGVAWVASLLSPPPSSPSTSPNTGGEGGRERQRRPPYAVLAPLAGLTSIPARRAFARGLLEPLDSGSGTGSSTYVSGVPGIPSIEMGGKGGRLRSVDEGVCGYVVDLAPVIQNLSEPAGTGGSGSEKVRELVEASLGGLPEGKVRVVNGARGPGEVLRCVLSFLSFPSFFLCVFSLFYGPVPTSIRLLSIRLLSIRLLSIRLSFLPSTESVRTGLSSLFVRFFCLVSLRLLRVSVRVVSCRFVFRFVLLRRFPCRVLFYYFASPRSFPSPPIYVVPLVVPLRPSFFIFTPLNVTRCHRVDIVFVRWVFGLGFGFSRFRLCFFFVYRCFFFVYECFFFVYRCFFFVYECPTRFHCVLVLSSFWIACAGCGSAWVRCLLYTPHAGQMDG